MYQRLCVIGGDLRARWLAKLLSAKGYAVRTLGVEPEDEQTADVGNADALLFAYPHSARDGVIPTLNGLTVHARDVLALAKGGALVLHGAGLKDAPANGKRLRAIAYADDEAFVQANAEISAEAAVYEAMGRTESALHGMTVLVTGYGRFGRALAKRLHALGAKVWVGARRADSLRLACSDGMRSLCYRDLSIVAGSVELLLNTVPAHVLGAEALAALPRATPILELASAPYLLDAEQAKERAPFYEILPALPARYAPKAAANALLQTIEKTLAEVTT